MTINMDINKIISNKKILIVDDDARNTYALSIILKKYQMNIYTAVNGRHALEVLSNNIDIDIILMDIMMPELDGYETTQIIRKVKKFKHLPIIAITAKTLQGDQEKCFAAGASDYLAKPASSTDIIQCIYKWLKDNL